MDEQARYRKKPVVVEAWRFDASAPFEKLVAWCGGRADTESRNRSAEHPDGFDYPCILIPTLEGEMRASVGDWIIKGVASEFYPRRADIFAATYDPESPVAAALAEREQERLAGARMVDLEREIVVMRAELQRYRLAETPEMRAPSELEKSDPGEATNPFNLDRRMTALRSRYPQLADGFEMPGAESWAADFIIADCDGGVVITKQSAGRIPVGSTCRNSPENIAATKAAIAETIADLDRERRIAPNALPYCTPKGSK